MIALAGHRPGRDADARRRPVQAGRWLAKADPALADLGRTLDDLYRTNPAHPESIDLSDWISARMLAREAEALLLDTAFHTRPFAP
jgi:hypothetical protein